MRSKYQSYIAINLVLLLWAIVYGVKLLFFKNSIRSITEANYNSVIEKVWKVSQIPNYINYLTGGLLLLMILVTFTIFFLINHRHSIFEDFEVATILVVNFIVTIFTVIIFGDPIFTTAAILSVMFGGVSFLLSGDNGR
ncbi:MAG: hypothetical protein LBV67_06255 [Streptococcaceae bacterium]|nr:hypothetical protein [Streptococcaceae bacterium]